MTVAELREKLEKYSDDWAVYIDLDGVGGAAVFIEEGTTLYEDKPIVWICDSLSERRKAGAVGL